MKNPFTSIEEADRPKVVAAWVAAGAVENEPSGWDLLWHADEWGMYTLGQVRRLAELAGIDLEVSAIDLERLLHSDVVTDTMEETWISGVKNLGDVYVDLILEYMKTAQQSAAPLPPAPHTGPSEGAR
jgi:hypothetical protein